jgi:hypothetical protein
MKRTALSILFLAGFSCMALSQSKRDKILALFQLMRTEQQIASMMDNMSMIQTMALKSNNVSKDSAMQAYMKEENISMLKKIQSTTMVDLYDKYFTIAEIQKYIDFYKTPEGQKMLEVMPNLQKDLLTNMMNKDFPEMQERLKKRMEQLKN